MLYYPSSESKKMKKALIFSLLFIIVSAVSAIAEPTVQYEIKKIRQHDLLVTFLWEVTVVSDKIHDACDLKISFKDDRGREIYLVRETLKIKVGSNAFGGHEICNSEVWERITRSVATLDCIF